MKKSRPTKPVEHDYRCLGCGLSLEDIDRFKLVDVRFPAYEAGCLRGSAECVPLCSRCVASPALLDVALVRLLATLGAAATILHEGIDKTRAFKQAVALLGLRLRLIQTQTHDNAVAAARTAANEHQERWWKERLDVLWHRVEATEAMAASPRALVGAAARALVARACAWARHKIGGAP